MGDVHLMVASARCSAPGRRRSRSSSRRSSACSSAIYMLLTRKSRELPYGPYLSLATAFVMLFYLPDRRLPAAGLYGAAVRCSRSVRRALNSTGEDSHGQPVAEDQDLDQGDAVRRAVRSMSSCSSTRTASDTVHFWYWFNHEPETTTVCFWCSALPRRRDRRRSWSARRSERIRQIQRDAGPIARQRLDREDRRHAHQSRDAADEAADRHRAIETDRCPMRDLTSSSLACSCPDRTRLAALRLTHHEFPYISCKFPLERSLDGQGTNAG